MLGKLLGKFLKSRKEGQIKKALSAETQGLTSVPAETRTLDPLIKSQLLYQLSYGDEGVQK